MAEKGETDVTLLSERVQRAERWLLDARQQLPKRLAVLLRRGLLPGLASIVCFGFALALGVGEWARSVTATRELEAFLGTVLNAEHEGRRDEPRSGRTALLLAQANQGSTHDVSLDLLSKQDPLRVVVDQWNKLKEHTDLIDVEPCGNGANVLAAWAGEPDNSLNFATRPYEIDAQLARGVAAELEVRRLAFDPVRSVDGFARGPAICLKKSSNSFPRVYASLPAGSLEDESVAGSDTSWPDLEKIGGDHAKALYRAATALNKLDLDSSKGQVQAFFVGASGGLAILAPRPEATARLWEYPSRRYDAAAYVEHFLVRPRM